MKKSFLDILETILLFWSLILTGGQSSRVQFGDDFSSRLSGDNSAYDDSGLSSGRDDHTVLTIVYDNFIDLLSIGEYYKTAFSYNNGLVR